MLLNKIKQYFVESLQELYRVTWPTKNRAVEICILVVVFVFVSAVLIAGVDFIFNQGYSSLLSYAQSIVR